MNSQDGSVRTLCRRPFEELEVIWNGSVYCCVSSWLPVAIGNLAEESLEKIWHSSKLVDVRESVRSGKYSLCSNEICPHLKSFNKLKDVSLFSPLVIEGRSGSALYESYFRGEHPAWPQSLSLSYDYTCRLDCGMCRSGVRRMHPRSLDEARASRITDEVIKVLPFINTLKIAGNGEPFDSRHYMRILDGLNRQEHRNLKLNLLTNGLGLTESRLQSFSKRGINLSSVQISIDAATKETYEKLRINGVFAELVGNLSAVSKAKKRQEISRLAFSFVVQAANFREMKNFVSLGKEFGADEIRFEVLDNWNVMGKERYSTLAVHQSDHPDFREFADLISDPIFRQDGVALGGLARLQSS